MIQFSLHVLAAMTAGIHMLSLVTVAAVPDYRWVLRTVSVTHNSRIADAEIAAHSRVTLYRATCQYNYTAGAQ